ncbi:hypothetical protein [Paraburkholderia sp. J63]|uniref:hypothetical protein n=1 Tax=Paraburkholderia sp. J63 TaxID=2805434 RepID=UPI002ABDA075|nr:hypothetical protein [Paraburkholderia sp. J63]
MEEKLGFGQWHFPKRYRMLTAQSSAPLSMSVCGKPKAFSEYLIIANPNRLDEKRTGYQK